jgi:perosamine synthetase|tara:strand:- start:71 stop:1312 length:1242 start_codon:yes stop_codon:yes gene_type:complete
MSNYKGWKFKGRELKYIKNILSSDFRADSSGTMNEKLEIKFAKIHKQRYAITANSGTSTLHMALNAFGVGHGDEVIIPGLTVAMCGYAVWQCGAVPVYADVKKDTFLIDPLDIEKKITKKTKAIMVVHLYGLMCDMTAIMKIAKKYKLFVLEDCAQCFFAKDEKKRIAGTVGDVGSWSFENSKHITTGDGGIVTTNSAKIAQKMREFSCAGFRNVTASSGKVRIDRSKFQDPNWKRHNSLAYNYRLPEVAAAIGLAQVERLNFFLSKRILMGKKFRNIILLSKIDILQNQLIPKKFTHSYYTFPCIFNGKKYGIGWQEFRKKFVSFGGDGIYAAWQTVNNEPAFKNAKEKGLYSGSMKISNSYGWGEVKNGEYIQRILMQFTTNQRNLGEMKKQEKALRQVLEYYEKKIHSKK